MFGLMRPKNSCSTQKTNSTYQYHRMHYCGTCKAIGQQFGHKSRMMLNFDTVFLSELLSRLNQEVLETWDNNLQKVNTCFSMPTSKELPFSLTYASTASVLLAELKLDDNIKDSASLKWRLMKGIYSSSFQKAAQQFETWGIDIAPIHHWIQEQAKREQEKLCFSSLETTVAHYAEATAQITGLVFAEAGLRLPQGNVDLYHLGYQFGQLMYALDAFEDYERDVFKQEFNPLAIYWQSQRSLNKPQLEEVREFLLYLQNQIHPIIAMLPLTDEAKTIYSNRLNSNLALRLYQERFIPQTFKERIQNRWDYAKTFAQQITCQPQSWVRQLNYYIIVWTVFISPQSTAFLPEEGKWEIFQSTAFITAILGSLSLAGVVRRKNKKEERQKKRREKRLKRFVRKLKNLFFRKNSCWSDCCSSCCQGCCDTCCETICDSEEPWFWLILFGSIFLVAGLIVLILFLVGVI